MWCHRGTHPPFTSVVLRSWAFCFKGSTLWMLSFLYTCKCDSLPSDVPFFIWENIWCVLRDGHTRPRNYRHVQTSAIFLQTKPAGRIFAIAPETAEISARSGARVLFVPEARAGPRPEPAAQPGLGRQGRRARTALLCLCSAQQPRADSMAALLERL